MTHPATPRRRRESNSASTATSSTGSPPRGGTLAVTTYNSGKLAFFSAPGGELTTRIWQARRGRWAWPSTPGAWPSPRASNILRCVPRPRRASRRTCSSSTRRTPRADSTSTTWRSTPAACASPTRDSTAWPGPASGASFRAHVAAVVLSTGSCGATLPSQRPRRARRPRGDGHGVLRRAAAPGAWREGDRFTSGVVLDVRRNRVVVDGLCMPHSPRWDAGRWWLCNSGEGALCALDPRRGACETVADAARLHPRTVLRRRPRRRRPVAHPPRAHSRRPAAARAVSRLRSGLWLVDPATGRATGRLEFVRGGREVYDVAFLPNVQQAELQFDAARLSRRSFGRESANLRE